MRIPRYWMTGCMALVLLAANQWSTRQEEDEARPARRSMLSLNSPYSPDQTIDKLVREARSRGIALIARIDRPQAANAPTQAEAQVLVFGTEDGNTPVMQGADSAELTLPLKVIVARDDSGRTTLLFDDPSALPESTGLSAEMVDRLASLPELIDAALG